MNSTDDITQNNFNRRVAPRYKSEFLVGMDFGHSNFCQSRALNISVTGMRVVVNQPLHQGTRMNLTLCLDGDHLVEIEGESVWQQRLGTLGTHVVGVAFNSGQAGARKSLVRWFENKGYAAS